MIQMALSEIGSPVVKVENNQCQFFAIYHQEEFG